MDDLRDYRFYKSDMLHPTDQALDYVWQKFNGCYFSEATKGIIDDLKAVMQAAKHRPVDPESNSFQRFIRKQLEVLKELEQKHPQLDMASERQHFERYRL